jgi:hypothetical protein
MTGSHEVIGSIPLCSTLKVYSFAFFRAYFEIKQTDCICESNSVGRVPRCQCGCRGFEPRLSLLFYCSPLRRTFLFLAAWPSGKAELCKSSITSSNLVAAFYLTPVFRGFFILTISYRRLLITLIANSNSANPAKSGMAVRCVEYFLTARIVGASSLYIY